VARNRALDLLRKERTRTRLSPQLSGLQDDLTPAVDAAFTEDSLRREQLRMMFACCDAGLQPAVQVALVLKLLCGFGVDEVAHAFLASSAAIEKRLGRGKAALRRGGARGDLPHPATAPPLGGGPAPLRAARDAVCGSRGRGGALLGAELRRDRLGRNRGPLRRPVRAAPHARGGAEPGHRAGAARRAGAGPEGVAGAARPRSTGALSLLRGRARRAAPAGGTCCPGRGGVPPRAAAGPQPRRAILL